MNMLCYHFPLFSLLILLRNHIILGVNVTVTADGTICVGNNITVTCKIDPFTTPPSASWNRNGVPLSTCTSGGICTTDSLVINGITYSFLGGSNEIKVSLQVQQVETGIQWNCDHNGITYPYTFSVQNECNNPCKGVEKTTIVLCITDGAPVVVEVIIVIIIIIIDTQKVKIIVTGKKQDKQLKSAKQKMNKGVEKTVNIKDNKCSIDVRGGDFHACVFQNDAGVVELDFMITDDLLNVKPGSAITLPTVLLVQPDIFNKQWSHDGNIIRNGALLFHTIVTKSTYGVYGLDIMFDNLELSILIKNMRVQARNWIIIMICVVVNVPLALIGGGVTAHYRSTDGFCHDVRVTYIAFCVPIIVYFIPVMGFIYLFFWKKTGNEKNSGTGNDQPNIVMINLKGKTSNESSLVEDKGPFKEISGRNNLLTPLQKEANSAQN